MEIKRTVTLSRELTLREIVRFVHTARTFKSHLFLGKDETTINGKGTLGLIPLFLQLRAGDTLTLIAKGEDAVDALDRLHQLYFASNIPTRERMTD